MRFVGCYNSLYRVEILHLWLFTVPVLFVNPLYLPVDSLRNSKYRSCCSIWSCWRGWCIQPWNSSSGHCGSLQLVQVTQCSDLTRGLISNHGDSSNKLHQTKVSTNQCISFSDILHCEKGIVYSNYNLILPSSSIPRVPVVNACTATQNFDAIKVLEDSVWLSILQCFAIYQEVKLYVLRSGTGSLLLDRVFLHLPVHTRGLWDFGWSVSVTVRTKSRTLQGRSWAGFLVFSTVPSSSTSNPFIFLASHVFRISG